MQHNHRGGRGGQGKPHHGGKASLAIEAASAVFNCSAENLVAFTEKDPFNPSNTVAGVLCKHEGPLIGSLWITHVNNESIEPPALIYGTPSLALPYGASRPDYATFPAHAKYLLSKKWNGVNVSVFKYPGPGDQTFISAKSRFYPFASESSPASLGAQVRRLLGGVAAPLSASNLPSLLAPLANRKGMVIPRISLSYTHYFSVIFQSLSFELCGNEEPHLVAYNFPLQLKPLFTTRLDGRIEPCPGEGAIGPAEYDNTLATVCQRLQAESLKENEEHRRKLNLAPAFWFGHFSTEGHVLYLLDESGSASREAIYKIKPSDVEPYHWEQFDASTHGRVFDALEKLHAKDKPVTEESLRDEMGIAPSVWGRFSRDAMSLVAGVPHPKAQPGPDPRRVLVMVGCPGSGKSTAAKKLAASGWARVNQDEMGTRRVCEQRMEEALKKGQSVVVDRCNFDFMQRHTWVQLASKYGVGHIEAVVFDTSADVCKQRVTEREDHPTIPKGGAGVAIVEKFKDLMILPRKSEGFINIYRLQTITDSDAFCAAHALAAPAAAAPVVAVLAEP